MNRSDPYSFSLGEDYAFTMDAEQPRAYRPQLPVKSEGLQLASRILTLLGDQRALPEVVRDILQMVKEFSGFQSVGIRLRDRDEFPCFAHEGFSKSPRRGKELSVRPG